MESKLEDKSISTKDAIVSTMFDLVAEGGLEKASINKLCKRVGITPPAVYYYFDSKVDIFLEVMRGIAAIPDYRDFLSPKLVDSKESYRAKFIEFGTTIIGSYKEDLARCLVMTESCIQARRIPEVDEWQNERVSTMVDTFESAIRFGMDNGYLSESVNVDAFAQLFYSLLRGFSETIANREPIDERMAWELAIDSLMNA